MLFWPAVVSPFPHSRPFFFIRDQIRMLKTFWELLRRFLLGPPAICHGDDGSHVWSKWYRANFEKEMRRCKACGMHQIRTISGSK